MRIKRVLSRMTLLFVWVAMSGEPLPTQASQVESAFRLWFLATDDKYQNARMVAFDMADQRIAEEIRLPPDLTIISATWSPVGDYIAAVIGEGFPPVLYGEGICVFSRSGEQVLCHEEAILALVGPFEPNYSFIPAPVGWTADGQQLVFVASAVADQLQKSANVVFLDVEQRTVIQRVEIEFRGDAINYWQWFGDPIQAVIIGYDTENDTQQLYSVELQHDVRIELLETYTSPNTVVFLLGNGYIVLREHLTDPDRHSVDVMRIEDGHLVPFQSLGIVEYQTTPVPVNGPALSNNGHLFAFTSWSHDPGREFGHFVLFVANLERGDVFRVGAADFTIDQITWSPDDTFIAAKNCSGLNSRCQIEVFSLDGDTIRIDTGLSENRDPMWSTLESQESSIPLTQGGRRKIPPAQKDYFPKINLGLLSVDRLRGVPAVLKQLTFFVIARKCRVDAEFK
jgi:hypothetical protein